MSSGCKVDGAELYTLSSTKTMVTSEVGSHPLCSGLTDVIHVTSVSRPSPYSQYITLICQYVPSSLLLTQRS